MEKTQEISREDEIKNISQTQTGEPNVHEPVEDPVYLRKESRAIMMIMIVMCLMAVAIGVGTGVAIAIGGA